MSSCVGPILWHYTSQNAIHAILSEEKFRLTHIADLADQSELLFGIEKVCEAATDIAGTDPNISVALSSSVQKLEGIRRHLAKKDTNNNRNNGRNGLMEKYILSFTTNGDSRHHWENFCSPKGGAIGFDKNNLEHWINETQENPNNPMAHFYFDECLYVNKEGISNSICKEIHRIVERLKTDSITKDYFKETEDNGTNYNQMQISFPLQSDLLELAIRIKQKEFCEEQEYRVIVNNSNYKSFEIKDCSIKKQCIKLSPMDLSIKNLVSHIILSPNTTDEDKTSLRCLINKKRLNVDIQRSCCSDINQ